MKLISLTLVRSEDWILGFSLPATLKWCDEVFVYAHRCTDRTKEIVDQIATEYPKRVYVTHDDDPAPWPEMDIRQKMLEQGRLMGGTHFAIVDADEALTAQSALLVRGCTSLLKPGETLELPMRPIWTNLDNYRNDNSVWCRSFISTTFCDHPSLTWKPDKQGYQHHHRLPYGITTRVHPWTHDDVQKGGGMHLQFVNWKRLVAKHRWYARREVMLYPDRPVEKINKMYNEAILEERPGILRCPPYWWESYGNLRDKIDFSDRPTWFDKEIAEMESSHGPFVGLTGRLA